MNVAICDDDKNTARQIKEYAECEADIFTSGDELLGAGKQYDIIFLDIEMPGTDGIETAKKLREGGSDAIIIFVSSHDDRILDSFEGEPFSFLVKPVKPENFQSTFARALKKVKKSGKIITLSGGGEKIYIPVSEIIYIDVFKKHLTYHTKSRDYTVFGTFAEKFPELCDCDFVEYCKGGAVNLKHIRTISGSEMLLTSGEKLYISERKRAAVIESFVRFSAE